MNYKYSKLEEILKFHKQGRKAVVIFEVTAKDLDEYINNCLITIKQFNVDINKFIVPRVITNKNHKTIILIEKDSFKLSKIEEKDLRRWINKLGNATTLDKFLNNEYKNKYTEEITVGKFEYIEIVGEDILRNVKFIQKISEEELNKIIQRDKKNIKEYISSIVGTWFKNNKVFVKCVKFIVNDGSEVKIKVEPTPNSLKLTKIK